MKNKNKALALLSFLICTQLLTACAENDTGKTTETTTSSSAVSIQQATASSDVFSSEDYYFDWKTQDYQTIDLNSGSSSVTKSGTYEITGTLADGSLEINVDKSIDSGIVYLILNNAEFSSSSTSPIYIKDAGKVVILLEDGSVNTISQGSDITVNEDEEPSAAIFSKSDLTITGKGTLNVTTEYNDGITSKDSLKITDGIINVNAVSDGLTGKDILAVESASVNVTAGKDGMRSTNDTDEGMGSIILSSGDFDITAGNDAVQSYGVLEINGGTFDITTNGGATGNISNDNQFGPGGERDFGMNQDTQNTTADTSSNENEESCKGLKSNTEIVINDGTFTINSTDDSVHSNGDISINGGNLTIKSDDDAVHSDTDLTISNGTITVENSYEGIEGANITVSDGEITIKSSDDGINMNDTSGTVTISGGTINLNADGDGIDSNASIEMSGGAVYVSGPVNDGNGSIDYQGSFSITGGTIVAAGSSGMAQTPTAGTQSSILMYYSVAQDAGTVISIKDSDGNVIASYAPEKQYSSAAISCPDLVIGNSYTLFINDTEIVTFTPSELVTYLNESGITTNQRMGGGMGGQRNQMPNGQTPPEILDGQTPPEMPDGQTPQQGDMRGNGQMPDQPQNSTQTNS